MILLKTKTNAVASELVFVSSGCKHVPPWQSCKLGNGNEARDEVTFPVNNKVSCLKKSAMCCKKTVRISYMNLGSLSTAFFLSVGACYVDSCDDDSEWLLLQISENKCRLMDGCACTMETAVLVDVLPSVRGSIDWKCSLPLLFYSQTRTGLGHVPVYCAEPGRAYFLQGKRN